MWLAAIPWALMLRRAYPERSEYRLWVAVPLVRTAWSLLVMPDTRSLVAAAVGLLIGLIILRPVLLARPRKTAWSLIAAAAVPALALGLMLLFTGLNNRNHAYTWSIWSDPRRGRPHQGMPLKNYEAERFGWALTIPSALALGTLAGSFRRTWRRGTDGPQDANADKVAALPAAAPRPHHPPFPPRAAPAPANDLE